MTSRAPRITIKASSAPDGDQRAVTLVCRSPLGVMVYAGRLHEHARAKPAMQIEPTDYHAAEKISFCRCEDVWDYFEGCVFADLVDRLRSEFDTIQPGLSAHSSSR